MGLRSKSNDVAAMDVQINLFEEECATSTGQSSLQEIRALDPIAREGGVSRRHAAEMADREDVQTKLSPIK